MSHLIKRIKKRLYRMTRAFNPTERRLRALYAPFAASPDGARIISLRNARKLHRIIRKFNARRVLELGTGIGASAAFIADALPKDGTLVTMEQNEKYAAMAHQLIPPELQKKITIVYSPPRVFTHTIDTPNGPTSLTLSGYTTLPTEKGPFDFVLIDGPGLFIENGVRISAPNGDLFLLLPYLAPHCVVAIDGRKEAVRLYTRFLADSFSVLVDTSYFALLRKK